MKFVVFDVRIEISYLFLTFLTLFIAFDRTSLFIPLAVSVFLHEFAHLLVIYGCGTKILAVRLVPGNLGVEFSDFSSKKAGLAALFAGPLCNLLFAFCSYFVGDFVSFGINLLLFIYNMLPVKGLDGGAIIELMLSGLVSHRRILKLLTATTLFTSVAIFTLFFVLNEMNVVNYSLIIFSFYLILPLIVKKSVER